MNKQESGRKMPFHWVRGHWRIQAYGPNKSLRKRRYVAPYMCRSRYCLPRHKAAPQPSTSTDNIRKRRGYSDAEIDEEVRSTVESVRRTLGQGFEAKRGCDMKSVFEWSPTARHVCSDCGVKEGQLHNRGCDMERCPFCLGQLISCDCCYKAFYPGYDGRLIGGKPFSGLPKSVYENGLPASKKAKWERILEAKGRIPHVVAPNLCARCGQLWPEMFHADDWGDVIPASLRHEMLCLRCYEVVKRFVLDGRSVPTRES